MIGKFIRREKDAFANGSLPSVQIHTKYVPDYDALATLSREDTSKIIDRSLKRLGVERLDLVQFAWWDYQFPRYVDTIGHLGELQKAGKIRHIGITNFDGQRIQEMLETGVKILGNQVQYSLLDQRVEMDQDLINHANGISYLCYGVMAGGFLSDRYLNRPEPIEPLENRSLTKYKLIIDDFGGYGLFQQLLTELRKIADQYEVNIGEIAAKYILHKSQVAGIIIGARNRRHLASLQKLSTFHLSAEDIKKIETVRAKAKGPKGPFYALERDKTGKHGAIMRYNLNGQRS